eukprot:1911166-Alexandrium_andersonii.AAC.1
MGILDGGASKSAAGIQQLEKLQEDYAEIGRQFEVTASNVEFTFADGERQAAGSMVIFCPDVVSNVPVGINCVETPTPVLLGLDAVSYTHLTLPTICSV